MNIKWIIKNGKFIFLFLIFLTGCSNKEINICAVSKPNEVENNNLRFIKIGEIRNDQTNIKEKIIQKMKEINKIVPNYFYINSQNYKSKLTGIEQINKLDEFYNKKVKIIYKNDRCTAILYPCKEIEGFFFCNYSNPIYYSLKDFNNIQKNSFQNRDYILINSQIYQKNVSCKPEFANLKCKKKELSLIVKLNIKDKNNNLLFSKTYKKISIDDPCENIKEIYPDEKKYYYSYLDFNQKADELANIIASEFIQDIAPHYIIFSAKLYDELDVKTDYSDEKIFENIIDTIIKDPSKTKNLINKIQTLSKKYPKSCVLKYDLAVMYMKIKNYEKAKNILLNLNNCNSDIQNEKEKLISILERIYF